MTWVGAASVLHTVKLLSPSEMSRCDVKSDCMRPTQTTNNAQEPRGDTNGVYHFKVSGNSSLKRQQKGTFMTPLLLLLVFFFFASFLGSTTSRVVLAFLFA